MILVILLAALLIYQLAIKRTISAYSSYVQSKEQLDKAANAPLLAAQLENELKRMNQKIGSVKDTNKVQGILELITHYCQNNNAVLREFPEMMTAEQGELKIETNRFVVQGSFSSLIGLVYDLEQKHRLGKISSVKYLLKKDMRSKETLLTATVFLQNVKSQTHEN